MGRVNAARVFYVTATWATQRLVIGVGGMQDLGGGLLLIEAALLSALYQNNWGEQQ